MKKLYDLTVATSKYTDRYGKEKSNWENIGAMFERDNGGKFITLKATFNPAGLERKAGSDSIFISLFPPKEREGQKEQRTSAVSQASTSQQDDFTSQTQEDASYGESLADFPF